MNPMEQIRLLKQRVEQEAEKLKLQVHSFGISPDEETDIVHVVFTIGLESIESDNETEARQTNEAFEALVGLEFEGESTNEDEAADTERVQSQEDAARENLGDWLNED